MSQQVQVPRGSGAQFLLEGSGSAVGDGGGLSYGGLLSRKVAVVSSPNKSYTVAGHCSAV